MANSVKRQNVIIACQSVAKVDPELQRQRREEQSRRLKAFTVKKREQKVLNHQALLAFLMNNFVNVL